MSRSIEVRGAAEGWGAGVSGSLAAVERPNGKVYRPRKGLRMVGFDDYEDGDAYVAIVGTHDIDAARAAFPHGGYRASYLVEPRKGWVRQVMRNGERFVDCWDTERGAAAVIFRESDDPPILHADTGGRWGQ